MFVRISIPLPSGNSPFSLASADVKALLLEIRRIAAASRGGEALAEELVHAGLLGIADAVRQHNAKLGPFVPFLQRSIETRMLDAYRSERRRQRRFVSLGSAAAVHRGQNDRRDDIEIVTSNSIFADEFLTSDPFTDPYLREEIRRFVSSLPGRLQYVVRRLYWEDASQADVAEELGVTPSAVTKYVAAIAKRGQAALNHLRAVA